MHCFLVIQSILNDSISNVIRTSNIKNFSAIKSFTFIDSGEQVMLTNILIGFNKVGACVEISILCHESKGVSGSSNLDNFWEIFTLVGQVRDVVDSSTTKINVVMIFNL